MDDLAGELADGRRIPPGVTSPRLHRNIGIEWRWGRGRTKRFPEFAAEMGKLKVDLVTHEIAMDNQC